MGRAVPQSFDDLVRLGAFRVGPAQEPPEFGIVRREAARVGVSLERTPPASTYGTPLVELARRAFAAGMAAAKADKPRSANPFAADRPVERASWFDGMDEQCAQCETDA